MKINLIYLCFSWRQRVVKTETAAVCAQAVSSWLWIIGMAMKLRNWIQMDRMKKVLNLKLLLFLNYVCLSGEIDFYYSTQMVVSTYVRLRINILLRTG